jgi:hypothetical protein
MRASRENHMKLLILLFSSLMLITACSPTENQTPKVEKIAESSRQVLDKTKMVEATMEQATSATKQSIDEQTQ